MCRPHHFFEVPRRKIAFFPFALKNAEEREAAFVAMESHRVPMENRHAEAGREVLQSVILRAARAYDEEKRPGVIDEAVAASYADIRGLFEALSMEAVPYFANLTHSGLKAHLPPSTKGIFDLFVEAARVFVLLFADPFTTLVSASLVAELRRVVDQAIEDGASIHEASERLAEAAPALSQQQAERIARTEMVGASNHGSFVGSTLTGLPLDKEWLDTDDTRTRRTHRVAGGQRVPLHDKFVVGGYEADYPGDPRLPGKERIQCRCTLIYHVRAGS